MRMLPEVNSTSSSLSFCASPHVISVCEARSYFILAHCGANELATTPSSCFGSVWGGGAARGGEKATERSFFHLPYTWHSKSPHRLLSLYLFCFCSRSLRLLVFFLIVLCSLRPFLSCEGHSLSSGACSERRACDAQAAPEWRKRCATRRPNSRNTMRRSTQSAQHKAHKDHGEKPS